MNEPEKTSAPIAALTNAESPVLPAVSPPEANLAQPSAMGNFLYRHRNIAANPVGHVGFQIIRNMLAAIPYGIATAAVWGGFEKIAARTSQALPGTFKSNINGIARSPLRDIAMIAAGFTLYRGTLKYVRIMKEHLFNPDYTREDADRAAQNIGKKSKETLVEIAPAEINSTPIGAIALGLGRRYLDGIKEYGARGAADKIAAGTLIQKVNGVMPPSHSNGAQSPLFRLKKDGKFSPHFTDFKLFRQKIIGHASMPFVEAAVFIGAFLSFFEVSDRIYKDVQVRRGVWNNEDNAIGRIPPEVAAVKTAVEKAQGLDKDADYQLKKHGFGKHTEVFGKSDPNIMRWCFSRLLPTVIGIGAYTFTKRSSYAAMGHFTGKNTFWKRALVEGAATSTFFVMTTSNDLFESMWKKWFEPKSEPQKLTPEQSQNFAALQQKLDEKHRGRGVAA
ncbi:MAG: hypothetical protein ACK5VT_01095 [Alphaproteobacteria bacterium]|jgi:hypothetical protein